MRDINEGKYRGGGERKEDTCDHSLSRRSLRVNTSRGMSWKSKIDALTHTKKTALRGHRHYEGTGTVGNRVLL